MTPGKGSRQPVVAPRAATTSARDRGQALKRAIHVARIRAGIDSDTDLAIRARVHYDTLMNWYSGQTVPRPAVVRKVADVLGVPYGDLLAAYDGRDAEPVPLDEAVRALTVELREFVADERSARVDQRRAVAQLLRMAADIIAPPERDDEPATSNGREPLSVPLTL